MEEEEGLEADHIHVCDAFPGGIPDAIIYEGHDHTNPYPGDHGIQYAAIDEAIEK